MKTITILASLTILVGTLTAGPITSVSDQQNVFTLQMLEPEGASPIPDWVILKNGKRIGTYGILEEAYASIPNKKAKAEIGIAFGQDYLKQFHSEAEAKAGIALLEKSTGPNALGLKLIKTALPTMKWR